jgi:hypothetical protein
MRGIRHLKRAGCTPARRTSLKIRTEQLKNLELFDEKIPII